MTPPHLQKICLKDSTRSQHFSSSKMQCNGFLTLFEFEKCNAMDSWGVIFFPVNYDSPVNGRNISGESLFPKGSHYLLVNNDRGSHYLLVKNDRGGGGGHFFRGVIFHGYTGPRVGKNILTLSVYIYFEQLLFRIF